MGCAPTGSLTKLESGEDTMVNSPFGVCNWKRTLSGITSMLSLSTVIAPCGVFKVTVALRWVLLIAASLCAPPLASMTLASSALPSGLEVTGAAAAPGFPVGAGAAFGGGIVMSIFV